MHYRPSGRSNFPVSIVELLESNDAFELRSTRSFSIPRQSSSRKEGMDEAIDGQFDVRSEYLSKAGSAHLHNLPDSEAVMHSAM